MNYVNEDPKVLADIIKTVEAKYGMDWEDDNTILIGTKKAPLGKLIMKINEMTVEGTEIIAFVKSLIDKYKKIKPATQTVIDSSVFENYTGDRFGNIASNSALFNYLQKELKAVGVEKVVYGGEIGNSEAVCAAPTVYFNSYPCSEIGSNSESGFSTRMKTSIATHYKVDKTKVSINVDIIINPLEGEKTEDINIGTTLVGKYFRSRNLIQIFYNPFTILRFSSVEGKPTQPMLDIIDLLKKSKIIKEDTSKIAEMFFVSSFMRKTREKLAEHKNNISSFENRVREYQDNIRQTLERYKESQDTIEFLEKSIATGGKNLFAELDKSKSLSFIKKMEVKSDKIYFTFIPTTLEFPVFRRSSMSKSVGKRTVFVGEIRFEISPSNFRVFSSVPMKVIDHYNGNPHTHGSSSNGPCFGDGDGSRKIHNLLAHNKFTDLAKMLWFWIKTHREEGAYVKMASFYDDRLRQGLPVWDEKGVRIEINDPVRIKTGEQRHLDKTSNYDENIKKYKDVKI